ncbi:hypothetical protein E7744_04820 [Citricoccus sp. SGAir0253]|nr:hypothetical protein E7744_04820 [Citricoccus sp. SGAir0253]
MAPSAPADRSAAPGGDPSPRRRRHRRADAAGTGPAAADGPEPHLADPAAPSPRRAERASRDGDAALSERDRWLLEQRPPHWG